MVDRVSASITLGGALSSEDFTHLLKLIADDVGYGSEAALSRAFRAQTGQSPRQWRTSRTV